MELPQTIELRELLSYEYKYTCEQQEIWRQELGTYGMTTEEWKQIWQEQNLDACTDQAQEDYLKECTPLLKGEWTAELQILETAEPLVVDGTDCHLTVDSLSVLIDYDEQADLTPVILTTMQDGTILCTDLSTDEEEWLDAHGIDTEHLQKSVYGRGTKQGIIWCYDHSYPVEEIDSITVYMFTYDTSNPTGYVLNAVSEAVYEKE